MEIFSPSLRPASGLTARSLLLAISFLATIACSENVASDPAPLEKAFPLEVGDKEIQVEVAVKPGERARGLMFRDTMPADRGMIFVFEGPTSQSFYMKNTRIPLDIAYITGDGFIREIYPMYPHSLEPVPSQRSDIQFALEMNQGWFSENGVAPGARINLNQLRSALRKRGFNPPDFGLSPD